MNLEDWLGELRQQRLSEKEKALLYARINDKIAPSALATRFGYYMKVGTLSIVLLSVGVYLQSYFQNNRPAQETPTSPLMVSERMSGVVQADTLGRIIMVEGSIAVYMGEEEVDTVDIVSGGIVMLQDNARIELVVRQGVKAIITGPAKFSLERITDVHGTTQVVINLIEGSYFELLPVQSAEREIFEDENLEETPNEVFLVKTVDFEIKKSAKEDIHVTITKDEEGNSVVKNQGSDILVKQIHSEDEITLSSNNQISYTEVTEEESEQIASELTNNQLTIRYTIESDISSVFDVTTGSDSAVAQSTDSAATSSGSVLQPENGNANGNENANQATQPRTPIILNTDIDKRVLDKELSDTLVVYFTNPAIQTLVIDTDVGGLTQIINNARGVVGLGPVSAELGSLRQGTVSLKSHLYDTYFVTPTLMSIIDGVIGVIDTVSTDTVSIDIDL